MMTKLKKYYPLIILLIVFILSSWAILSPGYFRVHDFTDGARIAEMTLALEDGHFPVRWTKNFGFGYGMPLFQFYGPLPFYVASFFYWLGVSLVGSIKIIILLANFGTIIGAFLLGRELVKKNQDWAGVLAAAILTLAPYRAVNIFVRGALSEIWGLMALPWILWSLILIVKKKKQAWLELGLSLTVLFLSHNISVLLFAPFAVIFFLLYYCYFYQNTKKIKRNAWSVFKQAFFGSLLGLGLSSFYLFPAFFEKDLTQVNSIILGDYFDYHLHFLYLRQFIKPFWGYGGSEWGPDDQISFFLGFGQVLVLLLACWQAVKNIWQKKRSSIFLVGILLIIAAAILLTTQKTLFIWEALPLLAFVQFPCRFIVVIISFVSVLAALVLDNKKLNKIFIIGLLLTASVNTVYFRPEFYLDDPQAIYYADGKRIRHEMSGILPDYTAKSMPFWSEIEPVDELIINSAELPSDSFAVLVDKTQEKLILTNFKHAQKLELAIADFPLWQVWQDGEMRKTETNNGHLVLQADTGEHLYSIKLTRTKLRLFSDLVSAATWIFLLGMIFI